VPVAPALAGFAIDDDAVRRLVLDAILIIRSDEFDRYFDLFTDDARWMMPSSYGDVGKREARAFYGFTAKFRFEQEVTVDEVVVAGDFAYVRISFDGYLRARADESAAPLRSVSRHLWILARQPDGNWKITRDIWNNPRSSQHA